MKKALLLLALLLVIPVLCLERRGQEEDRLLVPRGRDHGHVDAVPRRLRPLGEVRGGQQLPGGGRGDRLRHHAAEALHRAGGRKGPRYRHDRLLLDGGIHQGRRPCADPGRGCKGMDVLRVPGDGRHLRLGRRQDVRLLHLGRRRVRAHLEQGRCSRTRGSTRTRRRNTGRTSATASKKTAVADSTGKLTRVGYAMRHTGQPHGIVDKWHWLLVGAGHAAQHGPVRPQGRPGKDRPSRRPGRPADGP